MDSENNNKFSLGTVVQVKGSAQLIMILGYSTISNKKFDYEGCIYPLGVLDPSHNYLFSNKDIKKVIFHGYSNGQDINFDEIPICEEKEQEKNAFPELLTLRRLLPVGSVVKIKQFEDVKFMITANLMTKEGKDELKTYHYMASIYPIGFMNDDANMFFNSEDITDIYHFGYVEDKEYLKKIIIQESILGKKIHIE